MRIAFSGTHRSGKSTLLERVAELLPGHAVVDEPYFLLEEEGYEAADPPTIEDFEAQLERSLASVEAPGADVLFDRCPADILAYLLAHEDGARVEAAEWRERVSEAMQTLDLVVFVPLESPDRVALPSHEDRAYRRAVHEELEEILADDGCTGGVEVLRVEGEVGRRTWQVMSRLDVLAGPGED